MAFDRHDRENNTSQTYQNDSDFWEEERKM